MANPNGTLDTIQPPPNPAGEGNTRAVTHGARSERIVGPLAKQILAEVVEPQCAGHPAGAPAFAAMRWQLAWKYAQFQLVTEWLERKHDGKPLDGRGKVRNAARWQLELSAGIERTLDALALTPQSAAKVGVDLARMGALSGRVDLRGLPDTLLTELMRTVEGTVPE